MKKPDLFSDDYTEKMQEWKKNHPIKSKVEDSYWWFRRIWINKIRMYPYQIKWFFQRGIRGYSDRDLWDFDYYLAEVISKGCKQLSEESHGYPHTVESFDEWIKVLNDISKKFEEYKGILDKYPFEKELYENHNKEMFSLLEKHFSALWD